MGTVATNPNWRLTIRMVHGDEINEIYSSEADAMIRVHDIIKQGCVSESGDEVEHATDGAHHHWTRFSPISEIQYLEIRYKEK